MPSFHSEVDGIGILQRLKVTVVRICYHRENESIKNKILLAIETPSNARDILSFLKPWGFVVECLYVGLLASIKQCICLGSYVVSCV